MTHWIIAPLLLPLAAGALLLLLRGRAVRVAGFMATLLLVPLAAGLVAATVDGQIQAYALGKWPAPFGIVLVLDRLAAGMLLLTAVLAACSQAYTLAGEDREGPHFQPLFQFQLLGINGAFLTGDLFNLFVFFEILLIASYALLLHGQGRERARAGVHFVTLNLVGSAFFLIAAALLYSVTGTLNMADLARVMPGLPAADVPLAQAGAGLLLIVFGLKAALLPLSFWLPGAYSAAMAGNAALFAVMTKVGAYAILRVFPLAFGPEAGPLANFAGPVLLAAAFGTILLGVIGVLAAQRLRLLVSWLVVVSVGVLFLPVAVGTPASLSAALYYLVQSTLVTGGLFLLADLISRERHLDRDRLDVHEAVTHMPLLGTLFCLGAMAVAGLPPLSGFVGKVMILQSAGAHAAQAQIWAAILVSSLLVIVALARAGSALFWSAESVPRQPQPLSFARVMPTAILLGCALALSLAAAPVTAYMQAAGAQLGDRLAYCEAVLGDCRASDTTKRVFR